MANAKNPQLKHEFNILECLNRPEIDLGILDSKM